MRTTSLTLILALGLVACGDKGDQGDPGADGADGAAGADGADGAAGAEGDPGDDAPSSLVETETVLEAAYGCDDGYEIVRFGVDDGANGGTAGDTILQEGEVTSEVISCLVPDVDEDDIWNLWDNCYDVENYDQDDADFDGEGDACDSTVDAALMYGITRGSETVASDLYSYDPVAGTSTLIGSTGHALIALQVNPADGLLYGITRGGSGGELTLTGEDVGGCDACLVTLDTTTGAATQVTTLDMGPIPSLGFLTDGSAVGWTEAGDYPVSIDTSTGEVTIIGDQEPSGTHSMGVDQWDNVYWLNYDSSFYLMDPVNGELEMLGYLDDDIDSSIWDPSGRVAPRGDITRDGKWWVGAEPQTGGGTEAGVVVVQVHPFEGLEVVAYDEWSSGEPSFHYVTWAD